MDPIVTPTPTSPDRAQHMRGGFSLIEMLFAMSMLMIVLVATFQAMKVEGDGMRAHNAAIGASQTARTGAALLAAELREVAPREGDLLEASSNQLKIRLMRRLGFVCSPDSLTQSLNVWTVSDQFQVGDSVTIFQDSISTISRDDRWIYRQVSAVDSIASNVLTCAPRGTDKRARLVLGSPYDGVGRGAEVRSYETLTYGAFDDGGKIVLGRQQSGGAMVPILGPLVNTNGLSFVYLDANGAVVSTGTAAGRASVRRVRLTIRSTGEAQGRTFTDSVVTQVYLRNN